MKIVIDTNPLISMFIKPGETVELLFIEGLELFAPERLFEEIENNKEEILEKTSLSEEELLRFIRIVKLRIHIVPEWQFYHLKEKALSVCPDDKDHQYFALAMHLNCPLWSNEKKLKEQDSVEVYATHELMKLFNSKKE